MSRQLLFLLLTVGSACP
uniref:Uncharacterized protein n=1 Tax=Anguilla anguilla TaxID=7936 RepID=A0A0E9PIZ1_ANGAN